MKTQILTRVEFDSSHEDPACSPHPHGHTYLVEAFGEKDVSEPLAAIVGELDLRNLGRMMNGGSQSGEGIARWLLDRLLVTNPEVDGVAIAFRRKRFEVIRERR